MDKEWESTLCGCFKDRKSCLMSFFCPCVQYGLNTRAAKDAPVLISHNPVLNCCAYTCVNCATQGSFYLTAMQRQIIREKYGLKGSTCTDCLSACFCNCCVLSQVSREIAFRKKTDADDTFSVTITSNDDL